MRSRQGEVSDVGDEAAVNTGPGAVGRIEQVFPEQEDCYAVAFADSGVSVFLSDQEIADAARYEVLPALPIRYLPPPAPTTLAGWSLDDVIDKVSWERRDSAPRLEAFYSRTGAAYTYGRGAGQRTYFPMPFEEAPAVVREIWAATEAWAGVRFEALFMNWYRDGSDHLGWHADDSDVLDDGRPIAVVTLGAEREIWFRKRPDRPGGNSAASIEKMRLPHGSTLLMGAGMQQTHQHRIPKAGFICGPRVSFTFRGLKSV